MRFGRVRLRTFRGWNSLGGAEPSDCGFAAVPAGGVWAGVKYEMPAAGLFSMSGAFSRVIIMVILR